MTSTTTAKIQIELAVCVEKQDDLARVEAALEAEVSSLNILDNSQRSNCLFCPQHP